MIYAAVELANIDNIAVAVVAILTALALVSKFLYKIYKAANIIDRIYHEVVPNSGLSMRDVIDRIEFRVDSIDERVRIIENGKDV